VTNFPELVAAATVGIAQRPLAITELPAPAGAHVTILDPDPAGAVLDAAALLDAARRAGRLMPVPVSAAPVAAPDAAPEIPPGAGLLIEELLQHGPVDVVPELLGAAARAGFRAPAPLLPALLSAATSNSGLRAVVADVAGERGRWLAAQHPDWLPVVDAGSLPIVDDAWQIGRPAERRAWLADLRRRDPDAARDVLAAGWTTETGDDRVAFLTVLAERLSAADETFLDAALDDRKAEVRRTAGGLLARLPGSAYSARARQRAANVLSIERRALRRRIVVTLPPETDDAARRDGLDPKPPNKFLGAKAWLLVQIIAAAPLDLWPDLLGDRADNLVSLPVADDFTIDVHAGWRIAAARQRDAGWARALLRVDDQPPPRPGWPSDEALAAVLPVEERQARAAALLGRAALDRVDAALQGCPPPWGDALVNAVRGVVMREVRAVQPAPLGPVLALAARRLPIERATEAAADFRRIADEAPPRTVLPAALRRAADILDLRRRFIEELR
jgi:hypothetical protein